MNVLEILSNLNCFCHVYQDFHIYNNTIIDIFDTIDYISEYNFFEDTSSE